MRFRSRRPGRAARRRCSSSRTATTPPAGRFCATCVSRSGRARCSSTRSASMARARRSSGRSRRGRRCRRFRVPFPPGRGRGGWPGWPSLVRPQLGRRSSFRRQPQPRFPRQVPGDDRVNAAALRELTDDSGGRTEIIRDARDLDPATDEHCRRIEPAVLPRLSGERRQGRQLAHASASRCATATTACARAAATWRTERMRHRSSEAVAIR